jgi:hypothetical protein
MAGPLGDDIDVVVGDIRIRVNGKILKRDGPPNQEDSRQAKNQHPVLERKVD